MKTKRLFLTAVVGILLSNLLFFNNLFSQELNFRETVDYINDKLSTSFFPLRMNLTINTYGDCELNGFDNGDLMGTLKFNLNEISTAVYKKDPAGQYSYCFELICSSGDCVSWSSYYGSSPMQGSTNCGFSETNAKALAGAFLHLKKLIKANPF